MSKMNDAGCVNVYDRFFSETTLNFAPLISVAKKQVAFVSRALTIKKTDRVLDVPCGRRRHSLLLAQKGISVVGLDISNINLQAARKSQTRRHTNLRFERANMIDLRQYHDQFDVVLNLFTSFGYFPTDRQNEKVMRELASCLRPGGRVVMTMMNRDWLLNGNFHPLRITDLGKYDLIERCYLDRNYIESHWTFLNKKTNQVRKYKIKLRLYSKDEIFKLMKKVGLTKLRVYGDATGAKFKKTQNSHPYYIGVKK